MRPSCRFNFLSIFYYITLFDKIPVHFLRFFKTIVAEGSFAPSSAQTFEKRKCASALIKTFRQFESAKSFVIKQGHTKHYAWCALSLLTKYIFQNKDSKMYNRCTFMSLPPEGSGSRTRDGRSVQHWNLRKLCSTRRLLQSPTVLITNRKSKHARLNLVCLLFFCWF